MLLSLWCPKAGLLIPIIFKAGTDNGDSDVDGIAMVDVVRDTGGGNGGG